MQWGSSRPLRILDLDAECLPGHWIGGDWVSKIMTAIAWSWVGQTAVAVMTHYDHEPEEMAVKVAEQIEEADVVVGHFIRGFDLRLINGNLLRGKNRSLRQVMTHDTKLDLKVTGGRSLSQKNLAAELGLRHPKIDVTLPEWEGFNLRRRGFKQKGIDRVRGDVLQNKEMYERLKLLGWLKAPSLWTPSTFGGRYHA